MLEMFARALRAIFKFHLGVWIYGDCMPLPSNGRRAAFAMMLGHSVGKTCNDSSRIAGTHVFRSVTNLTGYHGRRSIYETAPVARRKERQLHARIWIIVIQVPSVEVDVEIASKFGYRDSRSERPRVTVHRDVFRWTC